MIYGLYYLVHRIGLALRVGALPLGRTRIVLLVVLVFCGGILGAGVVGLLLLLGTVGISLPSIGFLGRVHFWIAHSCDESHIPWLLFLGVF